MRIRAFQGDTVDLLCWRHYGRTQGVVEQVLEANPELCLTTRLTAGQCVELPDITPPPNQDIIQLWD
ncbi:tail protein X [Xenorhabdus cabanillasii]|uniref:Tail protein X n=1 Tax=Xenorhabdus cabanillasii JM26 TaxID=1427517 RepID=W1JBG2_9GAMM|nr:tail protein X [Xenorhabdus cabanillasii]PHM76602.1 tail protein [Xenorhabdus cabanillasii JM26]CDL87246.1 Tail protein X [Xenorhabdus cabanillasii JM26]